MARHDGAQDRLQVLYLGHSADVGALRRALEAHGAITRSRLTPEVAAVVADALVPADHPTRYAAAELGVPVFDVDEAIDRLVGTSAIGAAAPAGQSSGGPMIAGTIAVLVLLLAALGILGSVLARDSGLTPVPVSESVQPG